MEKPTWEFEVVHPRSLASDPHEAEFFHGEEGSEIERTDPLIREALQNSLDARDPDSALQRVEVRIAVHRGSDVAPIGQVSPWLDGLLPHLSELKAPACKDGRWPDGVGFLVVEDFGTLGLQGDVRRCQDPEPGQREDFYWFWRNVGRSGKSDDQRGRWGLGKTVFQASSLANTIFGLTVRADDGRSFLMGQCVAKVHQLTDPSTGMTRRHVPHGFFARPRDGAGVRAEDPQLPVSDSTLLAEFRRLFNLQRGDKPGLSIVSLFPIEEIQREGLVRSAISHFFAPIMRGDLVVRVCDGNSAEIVIDASSIETQSRKITWDPKRGRHNTAPPFALVKRSMRGTDHVVDVRKDGKSPELHAESFAPEALEQLKQSYLAGEPISVRFNMDVIHKRRGQKETWFDVFLEYDPNLRRGEDHYVRAGMKIGGIDEMRRSPSWRGLLLVEDPELSGLLGDVEGPAHNDWSQAKGRRAADRNWSAWSKRVSFVKLAMPKLLNILDYNEEVLDVEALSDLFHLPEPDADRGRKQQLDKGDKEPQPTDADPDLTPDLPPAAEGYTLTRQATGFHLAFDEVFKPARVRVRVAYDGDGGSPWKAWSPIDFRFDQPGKTGLVIAADGCNVVEAVDNRLVIDARPDSELRVSGFNPYLDLLVKTEVEAEPDETEEAV